MISGVGNEKMEVEQLPEGTPRINGVISAMPISYKLENELTIHNFSSSPLAQKWKTNLNTNTKDKDATNPNETEKSTKNSKADYDEAIWELIKKKRANGKCDNFYKHRTEHFKCRSLKEVREYETTGIRPSKLRGKRREIKSTKETSNEIDDVETEQVKKMDDDDSEKTLSPSPSDI